MLLWHGTQDTPRIPEVVPAGQSVQIWIGTYPIEQGQDVAVSWEVFGESVKKGTDVVPAAWYHNDNNKGNSYWLAELGPFEAGDAVEYSISAAGPDGQIEEQAFQFSIIVQAAPKGLLRAIETS